MSANRFYDHEGDLSVQLAPWHLTDPSRALFSLRSPIYFRSEIAGGDIIVPAGFISDLASIPQFAWSIFMACDDPRIELGGWVHDWLYTNGGVVFVQQEYPDGTYVHLTRQQCDRILAFEAMPELMATRFQQNAVYYALRLGGRRAFKEKSA